MSLHQNFGNRKRKESSRRFELPYSQRGFQFRTDRHRCRIYARLRSQFRNRPPSVSVRLGFQFYVDSLKVLVVQIFWQVLPLVFEPQEFSWLSFDVFSLSIGIGEFEVGLGQKNHDATRVLMHDRFPTCAVPDPNHPYSVASGYAPKSQRTEYENQVQNS